MADDQVAVELVAKVDQLNAGLAEAKESVGSAVEQIKNDVHGLAETAQESEGILKNILSGELFVIFAEVAKESLEAVGEAFEGTVGKAEEFGLANAKFASIMGTSEEHAAGLSAALTNVGASTETYESMALRLQHTLETSTTISESLKNKFKDSNGEFLSGSDLMERLKTVTDGYNDGADRTSVLVELLGRRAKDYYDIARVTSDAVDEQTAIFEKFGVQLTGAGDASKELEDAEGSLRTEWKAATVAIGQELLPVVTDMIKTFNENAVPAFQVFKEVVNGVITVLAALKLAFMEVGGVIAGVVLEVVDGVKGLGAITKAAFTGGDWKAEAKSTWDEMKTDFTSTIDVMKDQATGFSDLMGKLWGPKAEGPEFTGTGTRVGGARPDVRKEKKGPRDNSADTEIKDDEKLQLERVSAEEATNQHLLSMGQETVETFVAQQRQLEDERYAIQSAALEKELALPNRTKAEKQKTNDAIQLLEQTHVDALLKIDQDGESRRASLAKEQLANELRADDERLKSGIAALQEQANLGQISLAQRDAQEMELTQTVRREQLARLDGELATLTPETKAYEDVVKQKEKIEKQFTADLKSENAQRARDVEASVKTWVTPMTSGFKTAISDMIVHGKSFSDAMKSMGDTILSGFVDLCLQLAEHWLILQITNAAVAQSTQASLGVAQVTSNAAVGAAGAAASQAAIPLVGPVLAATAAAETFSMIMGYSPIASAAGGMVLDRDQLVFAHTQEMILPSSLSSGLKSMIESGGGGGNSFAFHNTINAPQQATLSQMLSTQGDAMMAWINQKSRDGAFRRR